MRCDFKFEGVLFRSDSRHNDRVVIETKLFGASGYCQKKVEDGFMLTWCNFKFDGVLFNLDTIEECSSIK